MKVVCGWEWDRSVTVTMYKANCKYLQRLDLKLCAFLLLETQMALYDSVGTW